MRRILIILLGIFSIAHSALAESLPFTDVHEGDSYYSAVKDLFDYGIIQDDGSHLFRPENPIDRDAFIGLSVSVSCHKCITPSLDDIVRYQTSPFVDLTKTNQYFYCISYASDKEIVQGYTLDATGNVSCNDGSTFQTPPFCAKNQTSRIEAVAMLLRQANLWNDTLNDSNYTKSLTINDVTPYWYGYAQKGIQAGILTLKGDQIFPDESITRGEYAIMASKILGYNQCINPLAGMSAASDILIQKNDGTIIQSSSINSDKTDILIGKVEFDTGSTNVPTNWSASWKLTNITTGQEFTGSGTQYPLDTLDCGTWAVTFTVTESSSGKRITESSSVITIPCTDTAKNLLSVDLSADPLSTFREDPIDFFADIGGNSQISSLTYTWDFGDGTTENTPQSTTHTYINAGYYPVTITITDRSTGQVAQSSLVIFINDNQDSDGDGVFDSVDLCPLVIGVKDNTGCPDIRTNNYGDIINNLLSGNVGNSDKDSDGDGVFDSVDLCPSITGTSQNGGCPGVSLLTNITQNACLEAQKQAGGLIIGQPVCDQCPCPNTVDFHAAIRMCDVVFPAILSPAQDLIYARGGFYQVR